MKKSSLKVLLALYASTEKPLWLSYFQLQLILEDISYAGLRSLVSQMKKKNLIYTELLMNSSRICITDAGKRQLELEFPAFSSRLSDWQGNLSCVVFLAAPKNDKKFRYLRNLLVSAGSLQISRGVYATPGNFPESLLNEFNNSYSKSVIVLNINKCIFGDLQGLIMAQQSIAELAQVYSGISKDVNHLLNLNRQSTAFTAQQKKLFYSVFNRFFENLKNDKGLMSYYFPQVVSARQLLVNLQRILTKN